MPNIFFDIGHNNNTSRNDRPRLIFLEGTDDAYFLDHLLDDFGANPDDVGLVTVGGKGEFPAKIKGLKKSPNYTQGKIKGVVIIKDADESFERADNEMSALFLNQFGVEVRHGNVVWKNNIAFGYFLLPGAAQSGDLEELCLATVQGTVLERHSHDFLSHSGIQPGDHFHKRKAQVYLAGVADELCRGAGFGFKTGKFDANHDVLGPLKNFLASFFETLPGELLQA